MPRLEEDVLNAGAMIERFDRQVQERRRAWDRYMAAVCTGASEEERGRLYQEACRLTDATVQ